MRIIKKMLCINVAYHQTICYFVTIYRRECHMILKRKIYHKLLEWKKECNGTKAILIEGARRIGKSTICEEFGKNEYETYILIDFAKKDVTVEGYLLSI